MPAKKTSQTEAPTDPPVGQQAPSAPVAPSTPMTGVPAAQVQPEKKSNGGKTCLIIAVVGCVGCLGLLVILGILAAIMIAAVNPAAQIKKAGLITEMQVIKTSLESYHSEKSTYPLSLSELVPDFLPSVPKDLSTNKEFIYTGTTDTFRLCAPEDTELCLTPQDVSPTQIPSL